MSKKYIKLELLETCEELASDCQDAFELEYGCPVADGLRFKCPFFGTEKKCHAVTAEMWETVCTQDGDE